MKGDSCYIVMIGPVLDHIRKIFFGGGGSINPFFLGIEVGWWVSLYIDVNHYPKKMQSQIPGFPASKLPKPLYGIS